MTTQLSDESVKLKFCRKCKKWKLEVKFKKQRDKKTGKMHPTKRTSPCFRCLDKSRLNNPNSVIGQTIIRRRERYLAKKSNIPAIILRTSKHSDSKFGRIGWDLDREFIADLIKDGCSYCGAKIFG